MQSVSSRIWTCVAVFISYDNNNYTTGTSTEFGSSTRGERDTILNHSILPKLKCSAHLVVFKISVGRDLQNSMVRLQLLNTMVLTQLQLSTWPKLTPNWTGPSGVPNSTGLQLNSTGQAPSKLPTRLAYSRVPNWRVFQNIQILSPITSGHDVIHTPVLFPIWGLLWQLWLSYPLHVSVNCTQCLCTWTKSRIVQSPTKLNDKI